MSSFYIDDYTYNKLKEKDLTNISGRLALLGDEIDDDITVELIKYSNDFPSGIYYSVLRRNESDGLWSSVGIEDFEYKDLNNLCDTMLEIQEKYELI